MSTTHLVHDTGLITVPTGPAHQIGPDFDVHKYSKIRVVAHHIPPPAGGAILVDLLVVESNVPMPLAVGFAFPPTFPNFFDAVFDVPGRTLRIMVRDIPGPGLRMRLFLFGLEL